MTFWRVGLAKRLRKYQKLTGICTFKVVQRGKTRPRKYKLHDTQYRLCYTITDVCDTTVTGGWTNWLRRRSLLKSYAESGLQCDFGSITNWRTYSLLGLYREKRLHTHLQTTRHTMLIELHMAYSKQHRRERHNYLTTVELTVNLIVTFAMWLRQYHKLTGILVIMHF